MLFRSYLEKLVSLLSSQHRKDSRMLYSGRYSTEKPPATTDRLVSTYTYPCVVPSSYDKASKLPYTKKPNKGAGFCQIANVEALRTQHGGVYVNPRNNPDYSWAKYSRCRSDVQFRRRLGKCRLDLPYFIHLQHSRDNEVGHHIEEQR